MIDLESSTTHVAVGTRNEDTNVSDTTSKMRIITCEGIFSDYNKPDMRPVLSAHVLHASTNVNSSHKAAFIGQRKLAQLVHKECTGHKGTLRNASKGKIYSCDKCDDTR